MIQPRTRVVCCTRCMLSVAGQPLVISTAIAVTVFSRQLTDDVSFLSHPGAHWRGGHNQGRVCDVPFFRFLRGYASVGVSGSKNTKCRSRSVRVSPDHDFFRNAVQRVRSSNYWHRSHRMRLNVDGTPCSVSGMGLGVKTLGHWPAGINPDGVRVYV